MPPMAPDRAGLAASNVDLGRLVASQLRNHWLDRDECVSAALWGLVLAAIDWPGGDGSFRAFARVRMRWQVIAEVRASRRRHGRRCRLVADPPDPRDGLRGVELRDSADRVRREYPGLTARQAQAIDRYAAGASIREVGTAMGVSETGADSLIRGAARRLRAATAGSPLAPARRGGP